MISGGTFNKARDRDAEGKLKRKYRRHAGVTPPLGNGKPPVYYW